MPPATKTVAPEFDKEGIALYCCDCACVLPLVPRTAAVISDPPYGIGLSTDYKDRQRTALAECNNFRPIVGDGPQVRTRRYTVRTDGPACSIPGVARNDFREIVADGRPFDPTPLLGFEVVALFGGNHFADKLPASSGWIVWDKIYGLSSKREFGFNDGSDVELIWTNRPKAARILRHQWNGLLKASERGENRVHPTQKPIALMEQLVRMLTRPGDIVFDPYMGAGATAVACVRQGRRFIGVEIERDYFGQAVLRVEDARGGGVMTEMKKQFKRRRS